MNRIRGSALTPAIAALVIFIGAASIAATKVLTTRQEVSEGLTCQCGCGLTVANCNHPNCIFAIPIRDKIDAMIAKGMSRPQIIAFFRAQYGEKILSAPTTEGFNLLAWTIPPFVLILGLGGVLLTIGRWRRTARMAESGAAVADASPAAVVAHDHDPALRRRFERDLKDRL
jgi:cytochrome c-type biogenesis protein CcmH